MNGIENIIQRIEADGQAQADAILYEAREKAKAISETWEARAKKESAEVLRRGEQAAAERAARLESVAEMEGRKLVLAAKQEMLSRAFDEALKELLSLPREERTGLLAALCAQASVTGDEEVILCPEDREAMGEKVVAAANAKLPGGRLTLSAETRPIRGGAILRSGGVEVNCAFDTLVRLARPELERQVAGVLFGE